MCPRQQASHAPACDVPPRKGLIMSEFSLSHMSDPALDRDLEDTAAGDFASTARLIARIAESDARRRYLALGYPSMHAYCVQRLHLSEDAANKRIRAARTARRFPAIFEAVAEGRLHLSGVCLLASWLTTGNADELLKAAAHQTRAAIAELLAARFPGSEMIPLMEALPEARAQNGQLAPGPVPSLLDNGTFAAQLAPGPVGADSA